MAHWNHRVWKETLPEGSFEPVRYSIRETYYNDAGEVCACTELAAMAETYQIEGDSEQDSLNVLTQKLAMLAKATEHPILDYDNFVFAPMGEYSW